MSHTQFTVDTYFFADGRWLFKQPQGVIYHWNQYEEDIKKSVEPSVCFYPSVCNANEKYLLILDY